MGGTGRSVHPVSEVRCWEVLKNVLVGYFIIRPALFQPDQNVITRTGNSGNAGKMSEKKDKVRGENTTINNHWYNKQTPPITQTKMTKSFKSEWCGV